VTVTDDGGSSGILRRELDMLPPGDVRNCMVALSETKLIVEAFRHCFASGRGLKGTAEPVPFGVTHLTGDFARATDFPSGVASLGGFIRRRTPTRRSRQGTLTTG
jgi:uncharacterized cofD-like protein